jgi:hypothetical protein
MSSVKEPDTKVFDFPIENRHAVTRVVIHSEWKRPEEISVEVAGPFRLMKDRGNWSYGNSRV